VRKKLKTADWAWSFGHLALLVTMDDDFRITVILDDMNVELRTVALTKAHVTSFAFACEY